MKAQHLLIRRSPGSMNADVFCGRAVCADGIFADPRDDHGYSADGVTCKWCLRRLGVRSVPTGQVPASQYETLRADRDRLAAEVERLRKEQADLVAVIDSCRGLGHGTSPADAVRYISKLYTDLLHGAYATAQSDLDATVAERDAAIASRDAAVARLATATIDEPRGCPTPGACSCPSRDSAVNDTAEAIAVWAESTGKFGTADGIRAGAWRGQNGGG